MPRVVYTYNEIIPAIVKQLAEPTVITIEGVEHTFIADSIAVICDDGQDDIAAALGHLAPQIQRPIISVGDYGFVKTLMSPLSAIGDDSPFGISFLKYSGLCSNDVSRALRVICGVYVDREGVIVPLAAWLSARMDSTTAPEGTVTVPLAPASYVQPLLPAPSS